MTIYALNISSVAQLVEMDYAITGGVPSMQSSATGRDFSPDRARVTLRRTQTVAATTGQWSADLVEISGWVHLGGARKVRTTRRFRPRTSEPVTGAGRPTRLLPPWFDTLVVHALRSVTEQATLPVPPDTVSA